MYLNSIYLNSKATLQDAKLSKLIDVEEFLLSEENLSNNFWKKEVFLQVLMDNFTVSETF